MGLSVAGNLDKLHCSRRVESGEAGAGERTWSREADTEDPSQHYRDKRRPISFGDFFIVQIFKIQTKILLVVVYIVLSLL